jgi:hypothetical protein
MFEFDFTNTQSRMSILSSDGSFCTKVAFHSMFYISPSNPMEISKIPCNVLHHDGIAKRLGNDLASASTLDNNPKQIGQHTKHLCWLLTSSEHKM